MIFKWCLFLFLLSSLFATSFAGGKKGQAVVVVSNQGGGKCGGSAKTIVKTGAGGKKGKGGSGHTIIATSENGKSCGCGSSEKIVPLPMPIHRGPPPIHFAENRRESTNGYQGMDSDVRPIFVRDDFLAHFAAGHPHLRPQLDQVGSDANKIMMATPFQHPVDFHHFHHPHQLPRSHQEMPLPMSRQHPYFSFRGEVDGGRPGMMPLDGPGSEAEREGENESENEREKMRGDHGSMEQPKSTEQADGPNSGFPRQEFQMWPEGSFRQGRREK